MKLEKIFNDYLNKQSLFVRNDTYMCYKSHLRCVLNACDIINVLDTDDITECFYFDLIEYFKLKNLTHRTINKRIQYLIAALKMSGFNYSFFNEKKLKENYVRFEVVETEDMKKIINYLYKIDESNEIEFTHKLAVMLLITTGIRSKELLNIEVNNINLESQFILLTYTKTGDERIVFFDKYTKELLRKYIELVKEKKYLLYNFKRNERYTYRSLTCFIQRIKKECNIKKLHPHMFRHSFATRLIDNHAEITDVSALLGHSSVRTTMIYVHKNVNKLKRAYDEYFNI